MKTTNNGEFEAKIDLGEIHGDNGGDYLFDIIFWGLCIVEAMLLTALIIKNIK